MATRPGGVLAERPIEFRLVNGSSVLCVATLVKILPGNYAIANGDNGIQYRLCLNDTFTDQNRAFCSGFWSLGSI